MPTTEEHVPDNRLPPPWDGPHYTPDEIDRFREEAAQRRAALVTFTGRFDADPEGVAGIFSALAYHAARGDGEWVSVADVVDQMSEMRFPAQHEESIETTLTMSSVAEVIAIRYDDDGDDDAPPTKTWPMFYVDARARVEMLIVGTRRWLEVRYCNAVRPQPVPVGVSRVEVEAFVENVRNHYATVDGVILHFAGTGEMPRPVDRAMVAEVLLARAERRARAAVHGLNDIQSYAGTLVGMVDHALEAAL